MGLQASKKIKFDRYHFSLVYVDIMSKNLKEKIECSSIKRNSLESFFFFFEKIESTVLFGLSSSQCVCNNIQK